MRKWLYRCLARAPLQLYRFGLGHWLGKRFGRLHHCGRTSGLMREVVLEVVRSDEQCLIVASGWGGRSQWYRNLLKNPLAQVDFAGERFWIHALPLSQAQGELELRLYERSHPWISSLLQRLLGPGIWRQVRVMHLAKTG